MAGYRKAADLPKVIPVFPLDGALLLQLLGSLTHPDYRSGYDELLAK